MSSAEHLQIESNGIRMHLVSQGTGPAVLFCHGFPGLWYSWRHQLPVIADAGFRAIAVGPRGPKPSETYAAIAKNHFLHLHYFQKVGPAEAELVNQALLNFLRTIDYA